MTASKDVAIYTGNFVGASGKKHYRVVWFKNEKDVSFAEYTSDTLYAGLTEYLLNAGVCSKGSERSVCLRDGMGSLTSKWFLFAVPEDTNDLGNCVLLRMRQFSGEP